MRKTQNPATRPVVSASQSADLVTGAFADGFNEALALHRRELERAFRAVSLETARAQAAEQGACTFEAQAMVRVARDGSLTLVWLDVQPDVLP